MRAGLKAAALVWIGVAAWAWWFGPVGFVVGGVAFLGGWALGHRTGRHDAEREHLARMERYGPQGRYWITDAGEDAIR